MIASCSVTYNGTPVDFGTADNLYDWALGWAQDGHAPGKMSFTYYNNNVKVDELDGYNVCELYYDENNDDIEVPTVQRVMLRNNTGRVTN